MRNIWWNPSKGPVTDNPYYQTAFQILGLDPDVTSLDQISQVVEQRRQIVRTMPGVLKIGGRDLTQADITAARQVLLDANSRVLEELLTHASEPFPGDELERIGERLIEPDWPKQRPLVRSFAFLLRAVQALAKQFAAELNPVPVPPYPIDATLVPPFGPPEDQD